jgi:hypothetical protein
VAACLRSAAAGTGGGAASGAADLRAGAWRGRMEGWWKPLRGGSGKGAATALAGEGGEGNRLSASISLHVRTLH